MPGDDRHVLLVIRRLAARVGGAERLACATAGLLAGAGWRVTLAHDDADAAPPAYPVDARVEVVNLWTPAAARGVLRRVAQRAAAARLPGPPGAVAAWGARHAGFTHALRRLVAARAPDVVVGFMPPANTPCLLAGVATGVPVIPTNHGVPEHDYASTARWDQNPLDRWLRRRLLARAAAVHVLAPEFAAWFPPAVRRKVVAIPNYVEPRLLSGPPDAPRRPEVLAVGRLVALKGHAALLDAWARVAPRHPAWTLTIQGDGPERAALQARLARADLAGRATLRTARADVAAAYRGAEVLCHPSDHEGFGLVVAEALACGLPVVAYTDTPGVGALVRDGDNGLLAPRAGGVAALAAALDRVISDDALRVALRARAPASVAAYTEASYLARWTALLDEVTAARRRR